MPKESWRRARLKDVCEQITDGKHGDCKNDPNSDFYFLSCKDVRDGWLNYDGARKITEEDFWETHRRTRLEPGDILITNSGTIGRMAVANGSQRTARTTFQKSVAILKPRAAAVSGRWLYYYLRAEVDRLVAFAGGTAQKNLLLRDMRAFEITIPPLHIQQGIAAILSAYDDLIENNTRRIAILEEMVRRLYEEWFVHFRFPGHEEAEFDGELPKGWHTASLGDLAQDRRDAVRPTDVDAETPYVGLEHLPRRSITLREWSTAATVQSTKLAFCENDILFGKIRPYFHKVSLAPLSGVTSSDTIVLRPLSSDYLPLALLCASSEAFVDHATQTSNGTKMPRADWKVLKHYPLAVPETRLLAMLNEFVLPLLQNLKSLNRKNANLRAQRDLLLPKLVSGEINVSEADERLEAAE